MAGGIRIMEIIDPGELGGGQFHLAGLLDCMDVPGFEVTVCASPGSPFGRYIADSKGGRLPVDVGAVMGPVGFFRLIRALKRSETDVLHLHGGVAGMWGRLAAILAGTPTVIYTCHGLHFLHKANVLARWTIMLVERTLSVRTDGIIYVSEHDSRTGASSGVMRPGAARVIKNGIDTAPFRGVTGGRGKRKELGLPDDAVVFGCVGRLHPQKGQIVLLMAMRKIVNEHPGIRLLLVGDGPLRGDLEEKARDWGLSENVVFLGFREDIPDILGAMDLFILPSYWEGLPISLLEAMAAGVPVIASNIGGVNEAVKNGKTGRLFTPGSHEELAALMERFLGSKEDFRAMAVSAREEVLSFYTLERMAEETMDYIREVHDKAGSRREQ